MYSLAVFTSLDLKQLFITMYILDKLKYNKIKYHKIYMEFNSNASCFNRKNHKKNKTTKLLNINTRFRNNYYRTQSTDFIYHLPYNIKNIINLRLESMQIPFNFYSFSSKIVQMNLLLNYMN